jgi:hypothetical protein
MKLAGRIVLFLSIVLVVTPACSTNNPNAPAEVSGKVTYNGQPVGGGTITFYMKGGGANSGPLHPDGTYEISDIPTGEATVTVETESANPGHKQEKYKGGKGQQMSPMPKGFEGGHRGTYVKIPSQYTDVKKTPLTTSLQRGKQVRDFDLKD